VSLLVLHGPGAGAARPRGTVGAPFRREGGRAAHRIDPDGAKNAFPGP